MIKIDDLGHYDLIKEYGFVWDILTKNKLPLVCFVPSSNNDSSYVNVAMARINTNRIEISTRGICYFDCNLDDSDEFYNYCKKRDISFVIGNIPF